MPPERIVLADDHRLVREALVALLDDEPSVRVIAEADEGQMALDLVGQKNPDAVVMDISMPGVNGIDATRLVKERHPDTRVIILSEHCDRYFVLSALDAGADGYVLKSSAAEELVEALAASRNGKRYLSRDLAGAVIDSHFGRSTTTTIGPRTLGRREREVLQLLADGFTSGEIASKLDIAVRTVETHRRNIMNKLDIHTVAGLTKYAIRQGLTSLEA